MFDTVDSADRRQLLADLRRRMTQVGAERSGPAMRPPAPDQADGPDADDRPTEKAEQDSGRLRIAAEPVLPRAALSSPVAVAPRSAPGAPVFEVPEPLVEAFPGGGLPRGGVISLAGGQGRSTLLLSLLAAPVKAWIAVVGLPDLGLVAGAELGLDLSRVVLIPDPGADVLQVLSILLDGFDLIAVASPGGVPPARLRVLTGKLRRSGAVLLVAGPWPGAELVLHTGVDGWTGIGQGHGRLLDRQLTVRVTGRRAAGTRVVSVLFRSSDTTRVEVLPPAVREDVAAELPTADGVAEVG